ncbi:MAG: 30S ribosomal protein S21 [Elusimicrobia bacterium]|nr:30S ribosomal protein S21 [Elusimicrobiota bacterium]
MATGPVVTKKENESLNSILRRFRRKCSKAGIKAELKKRRFHRTPSELKNMEQSKERRLRMRMKIKEVQRLKQVKTKKRRG